MSSRNRSQAGWVYFVMAPTCDMIKIGWTRDIGQRLIQLQVGSPVPVQILKVQPGDAKLESRIHRRFARLRAHGEWFRDNPEIHEYIEMEGLGLGEILTIQGKSND